MLSRKAALLVLLTILAAGPVETLHAASLRVVHSTQSPRADDDVSAAACRAVRWLRTQQKPDGGFGAAKESSAAVTSDVVYVLAQLGEDPDGPRWTAPSGISALDALQTLSLPTYATSDPGQAGKTARAVAAATADVREFGGVDLVATLEGFYDPAKGLYHPNWLFRHTLAVEGLLESGVNVPEAAYAALMDSQLPDGGWFWSIEGLQSDVDTTGRVLVTLGSLAGVKAPAAYARAAEWLKASQLPEGGWNTGTVAGPANANSTALAVAGLKAVGVDVQAVDFQKDGRGALDALLSFQEPSGAFVYIKQAGMEESRVVATTDVLSALAQFLPQEPQCGLPYLPLILAL